MTADRIFVTGASGYIARSLIPLLIANGYKVTGLARSDAAAAKIAALGATPIAGNLRDHDGLATACRDADGVVHLGLEWGREAGDVDRAAVAAMLDALAGTEKTFVYTSGIWVMGNTGGRLAGEMFPLKPPPLVAWRPAVERMVQDSTGRKIRAMVIRVASVYGRGGGALSRLKSGQLPMVGDGENHWSFVHVDDLADLYWRALEKAPRGELYLAVAGQPVKLKDLAAAAGQTARITLEEARATMGAAADAIVLDQRVGSTKAGRHLGWKPSRPSPLQVLKDGE